jgi:hypothetical protein
MASPPGVVRAGARAGSASRRDIDAWSQVS